MPSFLNSLVGAQADEFLLINRQTGNIVASRLLLAFDSKSRRTGLLHHQSLAPGHAMLIAPSSAIHTFFMRFPIDVAFVTKDGRIQKVHRNLPPWRFAAAWAAYVVVEMEAGSFARTRTDVGDVLAVRRIDATSSHNNNMVHA